MKPYKWEETEEQYLAIVKPAELFIEGSIHEKGHYKYETRWSGILEKNGKSDIYAFGFIKKWCSKQQAERMVSWINDALTWSPEEELAKQEDQEPQRKAA